MTIVTAPPSFEQTRHLVAAICLHDGFKWDGLCGACLDEVIETRTEGAVRFGLLGDDENGGGWD